MRARDLRDAVYVEWVDSTGVDGWEKVEPGEVAGCRTVGLLLHEDDDSLTVALGLDDVQDNALNSLTIPRVAVRRCVYLGDPAVQGH